MDNTGPPGLNPWQCHVLVSQFFRLCNIAIRQEIHLPPKGIGKVKVCGPRAAHIPGGARKFVEATCSGYFSSGVALLEPSEFGLPVGLLISPALVRVSRFVVYVPVVCVGTTDALLFPHRVIGTLSSVHVVSLPPGITG